MPYLIGSLRGRRLWIQGWTPLISGASLNQSASWRGRRAAVALPTRHLPRPVLGADRPQPLDRLVRQPTQVADPDFLAGPGSNRDAYFDEGWQPGSRQCFHPVYLSNREAWHFLKKVQTTPLHWRPQGDHASSPLEAPACMVGCTSLAACLRRSIMRCRLPARSAAAALTS